jgi:hypothetical protein
MSNLLEVGDEVVIGSKFAQRYAYSAISGKDGIVVAIRETGSNKYFYRVKVSDLTWNVQEADCILKEVSNNKKAIKFLKR